MAKISKVWMHFHKIYKLTAKCKICGKICPTAGNTSNLHSHLNNVHKTKTVTSVTSRLKSDVLERCVDENNVDDPGCISSTASTLVFNETIETISVASGSKKTCTNDFPTKITQPSIEKAMNYVTSMKGTLGVYELNKSHTSEYISQIFEEVLFEWGLNKSQIIAIVTDSGANIKKQQKTHSDLNLLVEKVRNIVKYVKNSVNVSDELRQYQANDGIPEGNMLKMILDVKTRWNSLYYMVDRFLNLFKIISNILLEKQKAPDCLTTREVNTLKEVRDLLQPLEDLTKKISGDKYPTISCMLP
ncbi:uncharacterized protein LOC107885265 [Acyrthosiphon pisum]|uniref:BED-type domain-containing protein n=1 Tax=Acyrthosiphon pisum TaxID=7029 RepID=A0A8R2D7C0_ACYPI|nr:uncharacterized protein LOC107885265 [Acyrthosiphon pisum]|eukprot:XP_016664355.1 PREDICTED: uncharacterized protein LOC107885265 [Acyrthosiphon pisum]